MSYDIPSLDAAESIVLKLRETPGRWAAESALLKKAADQIHALASQAERGLPDYPVHFKQPTLKFAECGSVPKASTPYWNCVTCAVCLTTRPASAGDQ